jgi:hypothetical protein
MEISSGYKIPPTPPLEKGGNKNGSQIRREPLQLSTISGDRIGSPVEFGPEWPNAGQTRRKGLPTLDRLGFPGSGGFFSIVFNRVILIK